jgi:hypothetical protein
MAIDKKKLQAKIEAAKAAAESLRKKHGDEIEAVSIAGEVFIMRPPTTLEYERCSDKSGEGGKKASDALSELAEAVTIYPEGAELEKLWERFPGAKTKIGNKALEMGGLQDLEEVKI